MESIVGDELVVALTGARAQVRSQVRALWERAAKCTWAQRVVAITLVLTIGAWAIILHKIYVAANTEERADRGTTRTSWSTKGSGQLAKWFDVQKQLVSMAAAYQPASPYDDRSRLVLVGDSITEAWRGSSNGERTARANGVPTVLQQTLAQRWQEPTVLGISGDQTQHVLWRLAHGEISSAMAADHRLLFVLLIGTNNLAAGHTPDAVARGVVAIANAMLNQTRGRVLVNGLLPRGDGERLLNRICPPHCAPNGRPYQSFIPFVDLTNQLIAEKLLQLERSYPSRLRFVNCGTLFDTRSPGGGDGSSSGYESSPNGNGGARFKLLDPRVGAQRASEAATNLVNKALTFGEGSADGEVHRELMPDQLHPNARGHRAWAKCLTDDITAAGWERRREYP